MNVYKALVRLKSNDIKIVISLTAKNISDLKRRLNNMNYQLEKVIE